MFAFLKARILLCENGNIRLPTTAVGPRRGETRARGVVARMLRGVLMTLRGSGVMGEGDAVLRIITRCSMGSPIAKKVYGDYARI